MCSAIRHITALTSTVTTRHGTWVPSHPPCTTHTAVARRLAESRTLHACGCVLLPLVSTRTHTALTWCCFHRHPHDRSRDRHTMGGDRRYWAPREVWSPAGGWWTTAPRHWKRNTAVAVGVLVLTSGALFALSASKERRPLPPRSFIPSQRWAHYAAIDDPRLAAKKADE